jgi:hypothetical protein
MTNFISPIDQTVSSVYGHSVEFKAGVSTHAPDVMAEELARAAIYPEGTEQTATVLAPLDGVAVLEGAVVQGVV